MSEKLPEPYGWLYYGSPDGPLFRRDHPEGIYWLCVSSAPVYSHEQMRVAVAEAAALRRERDALAQRNAELAARLAEIEAQEPACWTLTETLDARETTSSGRLWFVDPRSWAWSPLYTRPAPDAAPERAEPTDGCGACGDACRSRASCRLADESPTPAARPCRCGPDGCPDRVSCPRGER